jgi:hypothetical protein
MLDSAPIKPSRIGFWICLAIYLTAFALPATPGRGYFPGVYLFFLGGVGFFISILSIFYMLFSGFSWDGVYFALAVLPWLANFFAWCGFALYAQGQGRASCRAALIAVVLAGSSVLTKPWGSMSFYEPTPGLLTTTEQVLAHLASPAYLAWAGSMGLLFMFAGHLAWRQNRTAGLWPTPEWLAANTINDAQGFSTTTAPHSDPTSRDIVAEK